jgi:hypothetical protein
VTTGRPPRLHPGDLIKLTLAPGFYQGAEIRPTTSSTSSIAVTSAVLWCRTSGCTFCVNPVMYKSELLIMSLRSAAGIDGLQHRCSPVAFGDLDWTPGVHHQSNERVSRDGQTQLVMALFWVCDDGSDPPMMEVLGIKASDAAQVIDPTLQASAAHSDEGPMRALVRRYLERGQFIVAEAA